jgi:RNA polymerase sigma-70 factor (ECF subfamily)
MSQPQLDELASRDESIRCMERLAQGDESALADLHKRWSRPLFSFLLKMCNDATLAEDLVQEVFLRIWRAAPRYQPTAKFSTFLFHVARNHWLNEREKKLHRLRTLSLDVSPHGDDGPPMDAADRNARSPADKVLDKELGARIDGAVSRLPDKLRETWALAATQGLPYPEVAEILAIPVGTVKSRMFQAVRLLREDLAPYAADKDVPDDL